MLEDFLNFQPKYEDKAKQYLMSDEYEMLKKRNKYDDAKYTFKPEDIVKTWVADIKKDYDIVVAITGYEGSGKSTFAVLLSEICKKNYGYKYTFPKNPAEFLTALNDDTIKILIVDEAIVNLYSRNSMSSENKQFVELLTMCRSKNKIMLFLIPRLRNIDIYLRADRIFQWLEIRERNNETNEGMAYWFMRDLNDFAAVETFDMRNISFAIRKANPFNIKNESTEFLIRQNLFYYVNTYMGCIKYKVSEEIKETTRKFSEELKKENLLRAERDFYEIEKTSLTRKIKTKIDGIKTINSFYKLIKKPLKPANEFITADDLVALKILENMLRDENYNNYNLSVFKESEDLKKEAVKEISEHKIKMKELMEEVEKISQKIHNEDFKMEIDGEENDS